MSNRLLPYTSDFGFHVPWYVLGLYAAWVAVVLTMLIRSGIMDYVPIPTGMMIPTIIAIVGTAFLLFLVFYLVSYQERKSKVLKQKAEALKAGLPVDELAVERIESFHTIYIAALFVGIIITSVISYVAMISIIPEAHPLVSILDYGLAAVFSVIVIGLILDRVIVHPIADGTFKSKVLDPATDKIIDQFQNAAKTDSGLSQDQINSLVSALQGILQK